VDTHRRRRAAPIAGARRSRSQADVDHRPRVHVAVPRRSALLPQPAGARSTRLGPGLRAVGVRRCCVVSGRVVVVVGGGGGGARQGVVIDCRVDQVPDWRHSAQQRSHRLQLTRQVRNQSIQL